MMRKTLQLFILGLVLILQVLVGVVVRIDNVVQVGLGLQMVITMDTMVDRAVVVVEGRVKIQKVAKE
jgi:hypothetical protein